MCLFINNRQTYFFIILDRQKVRKEKRFRSFLTEKIVENCVDKNRKLRKIG